MRHVVGISVLCAIGALLMQAGTARAQDEKSYYLDGVAAFDAGKHTEAADAFRKAYAIKPTWKLLYNIGQSEAAARRYGLALEAFEKYLVEGGDEVTQERREEVFREIQRMRMLVGTVEVEGPDGVELLVDGFSRGQTPFGGPVRVAAGEHQVTLRRGEDVLVDRKVTVAGGMSTPIAAEGGASKPVDGAAEPDDSTDEGEGAEEDGEGVSGLFIAGIATGAAGLIGIGVGSGFAVKGAKDYNDYEQAGNDQDWDKVDEFENDILPQDRVLTGVFFGVGGALLATGITLIIIDSIGSEEEPAAVSIVPTPGGVAVTF